MVHVTLAFNQLHDDTSSGAREVTYFAQQCREEHRANGTREGHPLGGHADLAGQTGHKSGGSGNVKSCKSMYNKKDMSATGDQVRSHKQKWTRKHGSKRQIRDVCAIDRLKKCFILKTERVPHEKCVKTQFI